MAKRMELNCNTFVRYNRNAFGSITYLSTLFGVLHNPTKTYTKDNLLMMYI
jgi:hypothetical protein